MENTIRLDEFAEIFKYLINNNKTLVAKGVNPIAVGIEGEAGCGKTSMIEQLAGEMGMTYVKLSLSELEEVSDLTGFPIKEYKVAINDVEETEGEDGEVIFVNHWVDRWVPADMMAVYASMPCDKFKFLNESRMGYATPAWLPREENPNGTILLLDDFSRANSLFMQAIMELINTGKYISWKLPANTSIVLSSNPDNGAYQVSSLDSAQRSRFVNFSVKFDIEPWAKWAEQAKLDDRAINFAIYYSKEIFTDANQLKGINSRSYVTFCNSISGIKNWDDASSLAIIMNIAKGCFADENNIIGSLFTTFIANKLDKLISPKDMLLEKWDTVKDKIYNCVYENGVYRPEIASVLSTRLLNYTMDYFNTRGTKTDVVQTRLLEIINSDKKLFAEDLIFNVIKTLATKNAARMNKLMTNAKIRAKLF